MVRSPEEKRKNSEELSLKIIVFSVIAMVIAFLITILYRF